MFDHPEAYNEVAADLFNANEYLKTAPCLLDSKKFRFVGFNITTGESVYGPWESSLAQAYRGGFREEGSQSFKMTADKKKIDGVTFHKKMSSLACYFENEREYRILIRSMDSTIFIPNETQ